MAASDGPRPSLCGRASRKTGSPHRAGAVTPKSWSIPETLRSTAPKSILVGISDTASPRSDTRRSPRAPTRSGKPTADRRDHRRRIGSAPRKNCDREMCSLDTLTISGRGAIRAGQYRMLSSGQSRLPLNPPSRRYRPASRHIRPHGALTLRIAMPTRRRWWAIWHAMTSPLRREGVRSGATHP
jgi:hypothetical protein